MSTPTKYEGHTPGPWEARKGNGWAVVSLAAKQWPNHDASKSITGWGCVTQTEADARLIADAPALLAENTRLREALADVKANWDAWDGDIAGGPSIRKFAVCMAATMQYVEAALAAGKGERDAINPSK